MRKFVAAGPRAATTATALVAGAWTGSIDDASGAPKGRPSGPDGGGPPSDQGRGAGRERQLACDDRAGGRGLDGALAKGHKSQGQGDNLSALDAVDTWCAEQVVRIIERLSSCPDVDGRTTFDDTVVSWGERAGPGRARARARARARPPRAGRREAPAAEQRRARDRPLPRLFKETPPSGLLYSPGQAFGLPITNFGHPMWHQGPLKGFVPA